MDSEFHIISKIEAAGRQLRQAVLLFFQHGDDVSIHTISAAAYEVLIDLCKIKGIPRELEDSWILEETGVKSKVIKAMREPQNFFKHANKDPGGVVQFHPLLSACLIMMGI